MAKKPTNVPAKKDKTTTAVANYDYGEHKGAGFENQTGADRMVPFLNLLQKGSPIVDERDEAKAGLIFNTVTEEMLESVEIVPAITEHVCVEWLPDRGGFVAVHQMDSEIVRAAQAKAESFNDLTTHEGNLLEESFNIYAVLCVDGDITGAAVIPFVSTKIKVYRQYMERLRTVQVKNEDGTRDIPPMYAHTIKLSTVPQEHKLGKSFNYRMEAAVKNNLAASLIGPDDIRFQAGFELYTSIKEGVVTGNYAKAVPDTDNHGDPEEAPF